MAGLFLAGVSVPGVQASDRGDSKVAPAGEAEAAHREFVAYGEWVLQIDGILKPALDEIRELSPQWEAATRSRNGAETQRAFQPVLSKARAAVAEARRKLAVLPIPTFELLELGEEASPTGVHAEMTRTLNRIDMVLDAFPPVLKALAANDPRAAEAAVAQMLGSAATLFRAQEAMAGVWMATLEQGDPARDVLEFERLFFRSGGRMMTSGERLVRRQQDPTLGADLLRIADAMDGVITRGLGAIDAAQAKTMALILETGSDAEGRSAKAMLTKAHTIHGLSRDSFSVARSYVAALRGAGQQAARTPVTLNSLQPLVLALRNTRIQLDAVGTRQAEVMAGTR